MITLFDALHSAAGTFHSLAAAKIEPPKEVALKDPKDWKIAGKPLKRLDTPPKVTGEQVYGIDLKLPGMLCAAIKDCPVFGGKLTSFDAAKVQGMPGVKHVVKVGDSAVAVVADRWWQAKTALDALPATWDEGPNAKVSSASIAEFIKGGFVLRPSDTRLRDCGPRSSPAHGAVAGKRQSIASGTKLYLYPGIQWSETSAPPSNVMNSRRLTARCFPCSRPKG